MPNEPRFGARCGSEYKWIQSGERFFKFAGMTRSRRARFLRGPDHIRQSHAGRALVADGVQVTSLSREEP